MARLRLALRLVLTIAFTFFLVGGSLASAQRPGSSSTDAEGYVSELTELEVTFSDDWSIDDSEVIEDEPMREDLYLMSDAGILLISFNENLDTDPETLISDILDSLEADSESLDVVDEDSSRGFAWAVFEAELEEGTVVQGYVDVDDSFSDDFLVLSMIYAEDADFVDQYELAQSTVEIDGDEIMGEFDADEISELIGGGASSGSDDEEVVDEESTPEDDNVSETGDDGTQSRGTSSDSHVFEIADLELTVSGDVEINDVQYEEDAFEQLLLIGGGAIGAVSVLDSPLDAEDTLDSFMGGFLSEMEDSEEIDSGVDGGVAWTVYEANIGGGQMYVYATVSEDRVDGLHFLELIAAPIEIFEDEFVTFQDSVQVDGEPMFADVDIDDLITIIEG